jgi:hypothetical protein
MAITPATVLRAEREGQRGRSRVYKAVPWKDASGVTGPVFDGNGGVVPDRLTEERIARNDATFREANERIGAVAEAYGLSDPVPFICECAEVRCTELIQMPLEDYGYVRGNPRWFINVPGHEVAMRGAGSVVEEREGYLIVEKEGHAGEVAEQLARDPRGIESGG